MADDKLLLLEKRLDNIEQRVYGCEEKDIDYPRVVDTLLSINGQINSAVTGRESCQTMFKRIKELSQYLDPEFTDRLSLTSEAKLSIILSEEDEIRLRAEQLEKIKGLVDVLDSEHIKAVPSYQTRMLELSQIHVQQQDSCSELSEETNDLLAQYNSIIALLSKQFVQWDDLVTKLEMSSNKKPVDS